jgi:hypothetical protein
MGVAVEVKYQHKSSIFDRKVHGKSKGSFRSTPVIGLCASNGCVPRRSTIGEGAFAVAAA